MRAHFAHRYFFSSGGVTVDGVACDAGVAGGAANGPASPAKRRRRVSPISEKTLPHTPFSRFSVVSAISSIRFSDCWLSLDTVVKSQELEAFSRRCLCWSMAALAWEFNDAW